MTQTPEFQEAIDVWLRFASPDDEDSEAEANTYANDDGTFRVEWYLTAVGLVKTRTFTSYEAAAAWLTAEGFADFTS